MRALLDGVDGRINFVNILVVVLTVVVNTFVVVLIVEILGLAIPDLIIVITKLVPVGRTCRWWSRSLGFVGLYSEPKKSTLSRNLSKTSGVICPKSATETYSPFS